MILKSHTHSNSVHRMNVVPERKYSGETGKHCGRRTTDRGRDNKQQESQRILINYTVTTPPLTWTTE